MTTVYNRLKNMCVERGMFESQADEVMKIAAPIIERMSGEYRVTWNARYDDYPDVIYAVWWILVETEALKWIKENVPKALFRPMFEKENGEPIQDRMG